jgi:hypothetical protein
MTQSKKLTLVLLSACLFVFLFQAMGDQTTPQSKDDPLRPASRPMKGDQSDTERVLGYVKSNPTPGPKQNTPSDSARTQSVLRPSLTIGRDAERASSMTTQTGVMPGTDIYIRPRTIDRWEMYPSLAADSAGKLFIAWQNTSLHTGHKYIEFASSNDGGAHWTFLGYLYNESIDLETPAIAIGEGSVKGNTLLLAYVVNDGVTIPYIEVATRPLDWSSDYTFQSVPYFASGEGYAVPVIWTDASSRDDWNAYLCCEWVIDSLEDDVDVCFWKSEDGGSDWGTEPNVIRGDTDTYGWRDPDGAYSGYADYVYVVCYQDDDHNLYLSRSDDLGDTFATNLAITTITEVPTARPVDPEIEAAAANPNVMVACAKGTSEYENIGTCYSTDNGETWTTLYTLEGSLSSFEFAPTLKANEGGGDFHLLLTNVDYHVYYSRRPQDLSDFWQANLTRIDDADGASRDHPKKALATSRAWDFPYFAWADWREWSGHYDLYFDRLYPDDLLGTWDGQGVYFRNDMAGWTKLASPAELISSGDLDGDGTSDLIGNWAAQGGVWGWPSSTKSWIKLASTAADICSGDMDGDGTEEFVGTWDGQSIFYLTQLSGGSWVRLSTPATLIAAGDLDDDTIDDLIGVWPAQSGIWVKYSSTLLWEKLGGTPRHMTVGDMNGDGRDDLLVTWDGLGVYYRDSETASWVKMATPATLVAAGDIDGDGADDLIGTWPSQSGIYVKYSSTAQWKKLGTTAVDLAAGMMRGGAGTWGAQVFSQPEFEPLDGGNGPVFGPGSMDLSATAPGAPGFTFQTQRNVEPVESPNTVRRPGPGEVGFVGAEQENLVPAEQVNGTVPKSGDGTTRDRGRSGKESIER